MATHNLIARAMELARTGRFRTVTEIRQALRSERYVAVDSHLHGRGLRRQLRDLMHSTKQ